MHEGTGRDANTARGKAECCISVEERCHVYLFNLYMEKVPKGALSKGAFYIRPVAKVSDILGSGLYINIQRLELYT